MAKITGAVNLTGMIAPLDTQNDYPTHSGRYGLGGYREVADQTERDAITQARRTHGMLVFQQSDGKIYQLGSGLTNNDWSEFVLTATTDDLAEGSTNLYYTDARTDARIAIFKTDIVDPLHQASLAYVDAREVLIRTDFATGDNTTLAAANTYTDTAVANIIDSAPAVLDTLNELAAALGDDPNFATTVANDIGTKVSKAGDTMTGALTLSGAPVNANHAATKSYVDSTVSGVSTTVGNLTTDDVAEATNLYYTDARVDARIPTNISTFTNDADYVTEFLLEQYMGDSSINGTLGNTVINRINGSLNTAKDYTDDQIAAIVIPTVPTNVSAFANDAGYLTSETDSQTLTFSSPNLTISNGNTVDLSALLDDTDTNTFLSSMAFNTGNGVLTATLNDSSTVTVDLDGRYSTTDTIYSQATNTTLGLVKIGYSENGKNYPVELSNGQMFVNVPWTDTNTDTDNYVDSVAFNTTNGILTLGRTNSLSNLTVDLDGRYLTSHQSLAGYATETYVNTQVANLVDSAPTTLDTLNELAAALGDDPNFATTISTDIGNRVRKDGVDNGAIDIVVNNVDFIVRDTTDSITNFIWRDHSANELKLGTANAVPTLRATLNMNSNNITNGGTITANMGRFTSNGDASATSTGHAFQAGPTNSTNVIIDGNEIIARNNGALATLHIQTDGQPTIFGNNTTNKVSIDAGEITATGDICAYGTVSDRRQKENVLQLDNALEKVNQLNGYTFNYIGHEDRMTGVMAQEVQEVLPEAVFETNKSVNEDTGEIESTLAVRHGNMVGLLIEAIKDLTEQNRQMAEEIKQLKNKV